MSGTAKLLVRLADTANRLRAAAEALGDPADQPTQRLMLEAGARRRLLGDHAHALALAASRLRDLDRKLAALDDQRAFIDRALMWARDQLAEEAGRDLSTLAGIDADLARRRREDLERAVEDLTNGPRQHGGGLWESVAAFGEALVAAGASPVGDPWQGRRPLRSVKAALAEARQALREAEARALELLADALRALGDAEPAVEDGAAPAAEAATA